MSSCNLRSLRGLVLASALALTTVLPAFAEDKTATVTVSGGGNVVVSDLNVAAFAGVTLDGAPKTSEAAMSFKVSDNRGSGAGWSVTASATQFQDAGKAQQLPLGSLAMDTPTVTPGAGTTAPVPSTLAGGTIDDGSTVTVATAAVDQGMGVYDFASGLTVTIPPSAYAGTYTSTVTVTVAPEL